MLYHIIDEKREIIDSGENSLALRLDCSKMNARFGGKCEVISDKELKEKMQNKPKLKEKDDKIMKKYNRELTTRDIIGATEILVEVNADRSYPFTTTIPKEKYPKGHKFEYSNLININNNNTKRITIWHFIVNGIIDGKEIEMEVNSLDEFSGKIEEYCICIGSTAK